MEDDNKVYKIPNIPADAMISLEVSGTFLKKCQTLLIALSEQMGNEKLTASLTKFKDTQTSPEDVEEATLFIMTAIVGTLEKNAVDQKKVVIVEMTAAQFNEQFKKPT
jgi:hypothetical protein